MVGEIRYIYIYIYRERERERERERKKKIIIVNFLAYSSNTPLSSWCENILPS